ncbi:DUF998 domain-containing protein [Sulfurisphaera tokodaii]|uniref:DUF998 domain-containing protein n=1 Tax=Sulfurisphaera tokodaii (strain DSM 16993 / JCM 10545 / NBRC 100140 / 7) TaxID=273063 RepID=Q970R2_SULTO|nr:DUF998 domain-containing protein [Sulfurisphaera tokodaii]BAB66611.1 hypothetical protein STK_15390 [Sulfurisphaera tokodaii str. 7]
MRILKYTGFISAILAWIIIFASISLNPWFNFTKNAFSDLGGPFAKDPWLYNYGLIVVSLFAFLYAVFLAKVNGNKILIIGSAFVMVAAIFLALIGIYHEGTYPHLFVSTWFFIQFDIAILTYGIGLLMERRKLGIYMIILFIIANVVAGVIKWPSSATIEAWGISIIDIWVILSFLDASQRR